MLDVFLTMDVEVWCGGWKDIDQKFPDRFRQYIYGPTNSGNFGLPYAIDILRTYDLTGVFFVDPMFSTRFGPEPLAEIIALVNAGQQEVQLHLHPEWVDESRTPLLPTITGKRQHLHYYSQEEQSILIGLGARLLQEAGAAPVNAFRAGSFALNRDTLAALAANGIPFDSSYNASKFGPESGVLPGVPIVSPMICDGIHEYPITVFQDGTANLRHTQITACSYGELEGLLWQALKDDRKAFVLLTHNFELLNHQRSRPDWIAISRFKKLCKFLDKNRDSFNVRGFHGLKPSVVANQPMPLTSPRWKTLCRMVEQAYRRIYQ